MTKTIAEGWSTPLFFRRFFGRLAAIIFCLSSCEAIADLMPLNGAGVAPNIAEVRILDDRVEIALEVYTGDLDLFQDLLSDDWFKVSQQGRPSEAERLRRFSKTGLQIIADGKSLPATIRLSEPRRRVDRATALAQSLGPVTGTLPVPEPPEDDRVFYVELVYPFDQRPSELVISPPVAAPGAKRASIGFVAFHQTVPVIDFRYLSGPETLRLDWSDPWYSRFDNKNLKRHHDSSVLTYLYVDPREVRHETLIRIRDLQDFVDLSLDPATTILTSNDQQRIREIARGYFADLSPLAVDGEVVEPTETRVEFLTVETTGVQVVESETTLDPATALVGTIVSYPVVTFPETVAVDWLLFNERISKVQAITVDQAGPFLNLLTPDQSEIVWNNYIQDYRDPIVEIVEGDVRAKAVVSTPALFVWFLGIVALIVGLARKGRLRMPALVLAIAALPLGYGACRMSGPTLSVTLPGKIGAEASGAVVEGILNGIAKALYEVDTTRRQMAMKRIVSADAFDDVAPEIDRGLSIRVVGGGVAKVTEIAEVMVTKLQKLENQTGFSALATWNTSASASHWGHNHYRRVAFRALVDIVETEGSWKLAGLTVIEAKQEQ
ncbi:MAG: hypothetical protein GY762_24280 [Proteobacteria bacterium]|nr:hypothetical protein [Pseudomonadota bacterium]